MSTRVFIPTIGASLTLAEDWAFSLKNMPLNRAVFMALADATVREPCEQVIQRLFEIRETLWEDDNNVDMIASVVRRALDAEAIDLERTLAETEAQVILPRETVLNVSWMHLDLHRPANMSLSLVVTACPLATFSPYRSDAIWQFSASIEDVNTMIITSSTSA